MGKFQDKLKSLESYQHKKLVASEQRNLITEGDVEQYVSTLHWVMNKEIAQGNKIIIA